MRDFLTREGNPLLEKEIPFFVRKSLIIEMKSLTTEIIHMEIYNFTNCVDKPNIDRSIIVPTLLTNKLYCTTLFYIYIFIYIYIITLPRASPPESVNKALLRIKRQVGKSAPKAPNQGLSAASISYNISLSLHIYIYIYILYYIYIYQLCCVFQR